MFSSLNSSPSFTSPSLFPADRSRRPGKSMPMMDIFTDFSMVGVYKSKGELKFVHVKSEKLVGRFTILIFMDNKLSDMEIEEWKDFSNHIKDFKNVGASVVGVCTDSHISMRTMMMSSIQGVNFPIISDRDGDFSRAFGVLKLKDGKFGAARALVILDKEGRMIHMTLHSEHTRSFPDKVVELIKHLQGEAKDVKKLSDDTKSDSSALANSTNFSGKDSHMSFFSKSSKSDYTEKETEATRGIIENISKEGSGLNKATGEKKMINKVEQEGDETTMGDQTPYKSSIKDEEVFTKKKVNTTKLSDDKVENRNTSNAKKPSVITKPSDAMKPSVVRKPSDAKKPSDIKKPSDAKKQLDVRTPSDAKKPSVVRKPSDAWKPSNTKNPADAKKPADVKKPADAKKPTDVKKPADAKKHADVKKPADAKKPADVKKPADAKKPADVKKPDDAKKPADVKKIGLTPTKNVKDKKEGIKKSNKK